MDLEYDRSGWDAKILGKGYKRLMFNEINLERGTYG